MPRSRPAKRCGDIAVVPWRRSQTRAGLDTAAPPAFRAARGSRPDGGDRAAKAVSPAPAVRGARTGDRVDGPAGSRWRGRLSSAGCWST